MISSVFQWVDFLAKTILRVVLEFFQPFYVDLFSCGFWRQIEISILGLVLGDQFMSSFVGQDLVVLFFLENWIHFPLDNSLFNILYKIFWLFWCCFYRRVSLFSYS